MIPDSAQPIVAWKIWVLSESLRQAKPVRLRSPSRRDFEWVPLEERRALCDECTRPPGACGCGIYALKRPDDLRKAWAELAPGHTFFVAGKVHLWGRVIPGRGYYRAEVAYPASLVFLEKSWLAPNVQSELWRSLDAYGVPFDSMSLTELVSRACRSTVPTFDQ